MIISPFLVIAVAFAGSGIQERTYTNKQMLIFNAFKDRDAYRCGKIFRMMNPNGISCEITPSKIATKQNILLVGDSHADSIKSALASTASQLNASIYFLATTNPLMKNGGINNTSLISEALSKDIGSIVLHYSPGSIPFSAIREIVELASNNKILVSFIMPVPTWETHIPKALWENTEYSKALPLKTLDNYNDKTEDLRDYLAKINLNNFKVYEVAKYFCDEKCSIIEESGKPLYFDSGHLTLTGSHKLHRLFKRVIEDSLSYRNQIHNKSLNPTA